MRVAVLAFVLLVALPPIASATTLVYPKHGVRLTAFPVLHWKRESPYDACRPILSRTKTVEANTGRLVGKTIRGEMTTGIKYDFASPPFDTSAYGTGISSGRWFWQNHCVDRDPDPDDPDPIVNAYADVRSFVVQPWVAVKINYGYVDQLNSEATVNYTFDANMQTARSAFHVFVNGRKRSTQRLGEYLIWDEYTWESDTSDIELTVRCEFLDVVRVKVVSTGLGARDTDSYKMYC